MTNTLTPGPMVDALTQKLIAEATSAPASETHPLYGGADLGIDVLEFDVHVVASPWDSSGEALALCGETLVDLAHGLRSDRPMCWECSDILAGDA